PRRGAPRRRPGARRRARSPRPRRPAPARSGRAGPGRRSRPASHARGPAGRGPRSASPRSPPRLPVVSPSSPLRASAPAGASSRARPRARRGAPSRRRGSGPALAAAPPAARRATIAALRSIASRAPDEIATGARSRATATTSAGRNPLPVSSIALTDGLYSRARRGPAARGHMLHQGVHSPTPARVPEIPSRQPPPAPIRLAGMTDGIASGKATRANAVAGPCAFLAAAGALVVTLAGGPRPVVAALSAAAAAAVLAGWRHCRAAQLAAEAAGRALREYEERFGGAFEHASIGMALVAPDGRLLQVNESLARILGRP